jgi:succinate dehydrogenase/fumarate reductase cytochrome b subunit
MTRHTLAERLLIVLAVCGALTIFSLIGARLLPTGTGGISFSFSLGRVSAALFTVLIVTVVVIGLALVFALRSRR